MVKFNVNLSPSLYETLGVLAERIDGSMADVGREAIALFAWLAREYQRGGRLVSQHGDELTQFAMPHLEVRIHASASGPESDSA